MFHCAQLEPKRVADRPHAELRGAVRPVQREHEQPADRPDVERRPPPRRMSGRKAWIMATGPNRLTSSCLRKSAIGWNSRGCRLADARVVNQTGQATVADDGCHRSGGSRDRRLVRDVDDQRRQRRLGLCLQRLAVPLTPNPSEDVESLSSEVQRRCGADSGRRPRRTPNLDPSASCSPAGPPVFSRCPCHRPAQLRRAGRDCVQHAVEGALREE